MYNNLLTDWRGCNGWGRKATSFLGNSDLSIIPWRSGRAYKFKFPSEYYCRPHWLLVNGRQNHNSQNFFSDTVKLYVKHSTAPLTVLGDNKSSFVGITENLNGTVLPNIVTIRNAYPVGSAEPFFFMFAADNGSSFFPIIRSNFSAIIYHRFITLTPLHSICCTKETENWNRVPTEEATKLPQWKQQHPDRKMNIGKILCRRFNVGAYCHNNYSSFIDKPKSLDSWNCQKPRNFNLCSIDGDWSHLYSYYYSLSISIPYILFSVVPHTTRWTSHLSQHKSPCNSYRKSQACCRCRHPCYTWILHSLSATLWNRGHVVLVRRLAPLPIMYVRTGWMNSMNGSSVYTERWWKLFKRNKWDHKGNSSASIIRPNTITSIYKQAVAAKGDEDSRERSLSTSFSMKTTTVKRALMYRVQCSKKPQLLRLLFLRQFAVDPTDRRYVLRLSSTTSSSSFSTSQFGLSECIT